MTLTKGSMRLTLGVYERAIQQRLDEWEAQNLAGRIWQRDATGWTGSVGWTCRWRCAPMWMNGARLPKKSTQKGLRMPSCWAWAGPVSPQRCFNRRLATATGIPNSLCSTVPTPTRCVRSKTRLT